MFVIRETFVAKPGMASKLAKLFKDVIASEPRMKTKVMTDAVADFNTVVLESEAADLAEFERFMKEYTSRTDFRERMKGYTDMYVTGRREIYQLV